MGSGTILNEVIAAAEILKEDYGVAADIWALTSVNELVREGQSVDRWNLLHPTQQAKQSYITQQLGDSSAPVIVATDYMKNYAEQLRAYVASPMHVLGTDGFGRSDTRERLRHFFEVDRHFIAVAALSSLAQENVMDVSVVKDAIDKFGIDPEKPDPSRV